ncbi:hypothetical protein O1L44_16360 [Streptomyces noursei]|uniref:hypothetical protein n=1 Tax=Streptomyces noursei TaxID=1971 RepID=UPI00081D1AF7|nr:hypothetical protein SNOUR_20915 [Streptomyces noursei ATCC 11455]MCZ0994363.1 hypothetical protein [Streptomyces noursei]
MTESNCRACAACHRVLWADEQHRLACRPCERRTADVLSGLPEMVHELHGHLAPGTRPAGPRVTTSAELPAPINLHVLDQIAHTIATLDSWLADWHNHLGWAPPSYRTDPLTEAATALRTNLSWAVEHHPAIGDFGNEINELHRSVTGLLDPAARPRRIGTCPTSLDGGSACGAALRYVPGAATVGCRWCGTEWDPLDLAALVQAM